jgi:hypothetical protein
LQPRRLDPWRLVGAARAKRRSGLHLQDIQRLRPLQPLHESGHLGVRPCERERARGGADLHGAQRCRRQERVVDLDGFAKPPAQHLQPAHPVRLVLAQLQRVRGLPPVRLHRQNGGSNQTASGRWPPPRRAGAGRFVVATGHAERSPQAMRSPSRLAPAERTSASPASRSCRVGHEHPARNVGHAVSGARSQAKYPSRSIADTNAHDLRLCNTNPRGPQATDPLTSRPYVRPRRCR